MARRARGVAGTRVRAGRRARRARGDGVTGAEGDRPQTRRRAARGRRGGDWDRRAAMGRRGGGGTLAEGGDQW